MLKLQDEADLDQAKSRTPAITSTLARVTRTTRSRVSAEAVTAIIVARNSTWLHKEAAGGHLPVSSGQITGLGLQPVADDALFDRHRAHRRIGIFDGIAARARDSRRSNCGDGDRAAKIIQDALGIDGDDVAN